MVERVYGLPPKERKLYHLGGLGTSSRFGVHNNSLQNLRRGLVERVFYVEGKEGLEEAPKPEKDIFHSLGYFRKRLHAIVGTHSRISEDEFLDFYQGRRKTIYREAICSLQGKAVEKRDAYLKTFVKAEKINFTKKPDPAPRVIQPRNVRYNVEVGRYLRRFEHSVYRGIDAIWGGPTVIKGYTVEQIGGIVEEAWGQFTNPVAIGFDMKRFDQHVSVDALRWEHSCYLDAFSRCAHLNKLLEWQLVNKGVGLASDGQIRYKTEGCRMSGDMNTAMGNCLLACAITHGFCREIGLKARLINNGDDCVLICDGKRAAEVRSGIVKHWRKFGFQCELECDATKIEKVEFCQMQPVFCPNKYGNYIMVRNPHISLAKDTYSVGAWNGIDHAKKWTRAVGQCGISLTGGIPIVQEFYEALIRNTTDVDHRKIFNDVAFASGFRQLAKLGSRSWQPVLEETRVSFFEAFDITPDTQTMLEDEYKMVNLKFAFCPKGTPTQQPISWILNNLASKT